MTTDPQPTRATPSRDPLDDHLDALGDQLAAGSARADGRRRRMLAGVALSTTALATGIAAAALPPGQVAKRLDPVAEAKAAVAPQQASILHLTAAVNVIRPGRGGKPVKTKNPDDPAHGMEMWVATSGTPRWRTRPAATPFRPGTCSGAIFTRPQFAGRNHRWPQVTMIAPRESALAGNTIASYSAFSRGLVIRRLPAGGGSPNTPLWFGAEDAPGTQRDPVTAIRAALDEGQLRDAGETTRHGRAVRKLVGTAAAASAPDADPGDVVKPTKLTYYVDATTFAPVELRAASYVTWSRAGGKRRQAWTTTIIRIGVFERLPDTPEHRQVLKILPPPGTAVVRIGRTGIPRDPQHVPRRLTFRGVKDATRACHAARARTP